MGALTTVADELARVPANHWVALTLDESAIVCYAPTLEGAIAGAAERGITDPVMLKTPNTWDFLIP